MGPNPTKTKTKRRGTKGHRRTKRILSKGSTSVEFNPSQHGFVINFKLPHMDTRPRGPAASSALDPLRQYNLVVARDAGDVSQQITALDIKPGVPISAATLPHVISDIKVIMGDVFSNRQSVDRFLKQELSPISGKPWIDAIAAGEIAAFLISLNEMKYGSRG